jgi:dolichol kinase
VRPMAVREAIIRALAADWQGALVVALAIVALFGTGELLRRRLGVETEYTRKLSHLGAGLIVIAFPWLMSDVVTVIILSIAFAGLLLAGKLTGTLGSVHNVERRTSGAYYYPFAVLGLFWLSEGDPLLYCPPIAVLAISDTGAAIVGKRSGRRRYRVLDGARSVEGSLTFFALTFGILIASLAIAGRPGWPEMLLVTLVVSIMATATEAVSVRGADNLLIPYACFLILERTLRLGLADLSGWFEGMIITLAAVVLSWRRSGLTEAGGLLIFVIGTLAWALGGVLWALPLAALYAFFVAVIPDEDLDEDLKLNQDTDLIDVFPATAAAMIITLAFGHFEDPSLFIPYLTTLSAGGALAMGRMAKMRGWPPIPLVLSGAVVPVLPVTAIDPTVPVLPIALFGAGALGTFLLLSRTGFVGRRLLATLLSGALAWRILC